MAQLATNARAETLVGSPPGLVNKMVIDFEPDCCSEERTISTE